MKFSEIVRTIDMNDIRRRVRECTADDAERALARERPTPDDFPMLFSEAAGAYLEEMARRSAAITERRFGRVIHLYTPLYLTNECVNTCGYCGFSRKLDIPRITLTPDQAIRESQVLYDEGFRHILLVAGESRRHVDLPYLLQVARALHGRFDSIAIEINTMTRAHYDALAAAGVDGLVIYQETYDPVRYRQMHQAGPKRIYDRRLDSIEDGAMAGFRSLGIGALLGLSDWRLEAVVLALHGRFLTRRFWQSRIAVSFPRIREAAGHYRPEFPVSDAELVQLICAMRLVLPDAELVMSTRESARLRDHLIGMGITRMSAGSRTNPGGYSHPESGGEQFEVEDNRPPDEVARVIAARGCEPVWKDFDRAFLAGL